VGYPRWVAERTSHVEEVQGAHVWTTGRLCLCRRLLRLDLSHPATRRMRKILRLRLHPRFPMVLVAGLESSQSSSVSTRLTRTRKSPLQKTMNQRKPFFSVFCFFFSLASVVLVPCVDSECFASGKSACVTLLRVTDCVIYQSAREHLLHCIHRVRS